MAVLALGATALAPLVGVAPAFAATGGQYLSQATDPHGNIWLRGTTDGTTTGPMDDGTNADLASFGHLWTTDVPSGFCRILPTTQTTDPATGAVTVTPAVIDRSTPGGCIKAGGKAGAPTLDPRRNADGTFYVYTPDWAVGSSGVYRVTYNPGTQTMTNSELLAPNRYPTNNKPFDTAMGVTDKKLYVSSDLNGDIARIVGQNGPTSLQTVETGIAKSSDGTRVRALTFVCWSNLATLNGGKGGSRAAGAPGCTPQDPTPDLVLAQKSSLAVVLNAQTCQASGTCSTILASVPGAPAGPKVLTPMGLRTDPADPTVFYVSDSPGNITHINRYSISTDVQDSYANFGLLDDGTLSQLSFAFSVGFDPQHAMYIGDDPSAGTSAFNGRYFRIGPNQPADVLGAPGLPATAPAPPPIGPPGNLVGGTFGTTTPPLGFTAPTLPSDGVWLGAHLWLPDSVKGLCRMDVPTGGTLSFINDSTCMNGANVPGFTKPEQSAFDKSRNLLYVADGGSKSIGVVRFHFDPATETLSTPEIVASGLAGTGAGLDGQRADAVALDPLTDALYVGFRARNLTAATQIARVPNASGLVGSQNVEFISKTTRSVPVFGLAIIVNPAAAGAPANSDLYVADNKGVDLLTNVAACAPGACTSILALNTRAPKGFATDGTGLIYMAAPPAPGTGTSTTAVTRFTVATGSVDTYSTTGVNPDATQTSYAFVFSLALDPAGNLYVADNPSAVGPPTGLANAAHLWKVPSGVPGPRQPSITSKPANPTNHNNSTPALATSFSFSSTTPSGTFKCSLVATGSPDAFAPCTSPFAPPATTTLVDGSYTFRVISVDPAGASSTPAVYTFTIDTVAPVVSILAAPASPTKANTPSFTFSSSKPSTTFACSLSTGPDAFGPCGSPQTYPAQPDGSYTFKVQGTDLAGNTSTVASSALVIDTVAPVVTASPAGGAYAATQSVTLTANEPASIFFTTDGTTPTAASTPYTAPIAINGSTVLRYLATDPAGNSSTASQTYTIGSVSLDSKPASPTANSNLPFTFSAPGVTGPSFTCALTKIAPTAADFTACTSPKSYPATADGSYTFTVQGTDATGVSVGSATTQLVLDAAAPTFTSNPPNPSTSATETFAFSKAQAAGWTFQCSFVLATAADAFGPCTSPDSHSGTADGAYNYKVKALGADGSTTAVQPYSFSVTAGAAAPNPPTALAASLVTPSGPVSTSSVPVTLNWAAGSANTVSYELQQSLNGGSFLDLAGGSCTAAAPCTVTTATVNDTPSATNQSTVTSYRYQVRAQNSAGAWGPYSAVIGFSLPVTDNNGGFSFNGGWSGVNLAGAFNGSVQQSSTTGAFASNPLFGSNVAWVSTTGPDRGMATVSVDGGPAQTVDLYSPTQQTARIVWTATGLGTANGHTIKVTVLSTKNPASAGNKIDIDAYLGLK